MHRHTCASSHLGDLHTPVEQTLGLQVVLVLPEVLQQRAVCAQLGHQLKGGARADAQQPHDVGVVKTAYGQHVLWAQCRRVEIEM